ncbi:hypothetical protein E2C01_063935 [Portunus trituberculatus]|uniref:Uncharacterized protein n=1 Tax=Portunus trituberculatus TaxID=210409 RepID=A0A5B7HJI2_PORTR|nr:hypothetical protein [Portunus trituberculatus]
MGMVQVQGEGAPGWGGARLAAGMVWWVAGTALHAETEAVCTFRIASKGLQPQAARWRLLFALTGRE